MASLHNINHDGAYDGQQRSLEDFQFDLENGTKNNTAAEVAVEIVTDAPKLSGQKVLYAVLAANTARQAKVIVREDNTKNGAWASAKLFQRFGRDSGATISQKVSKLPHGSLSSQAIDQLTISGLSRHGQPELKNHLRPRALMAWQDIQTQVEKISLHNLLPQSPQPMDISAALAGSK